MRLFFQFKKPTRAELFHPKFVLSVFGLSIVTLMGAYPLLAMAAGTDPAVNPALEVWGLLLLFVIVLIKDIIPFLIKKPPVIPAPNAIITVDRADFDRLKEDHDRLIAALQRIEHLEDYRDRMIRLADEDSKTGMKRTR